MKKQRIFPASVVIMGLVLLLSCSDSNSNQYGLLDGGFIQIPPVKGWVLVNFWAPWCEPCLKEIPELNALSKQLPSPLVAMVGIYFDPVEQKTLRKAQQKYRISFPLLSPSVKSLPVPLPQSLPANYLINSQGDIFGPLLGPQTQQSIRLAIKKFQSK